MVEQEILEMLTTMVEEKDAYTAGIQNALQYIVQKLLKL